MNEGRIKFRHLQCFLAVTQHSNLKKAAAALSITHPAVSKSIKELEDILDFQLFERGRRGVKLTARAESFVVHAEAVMQAMRRASSFAAPLAAAGTAPIRIGSTPSITVSFIPQALIGFRHQAPGTQISLMTGYTNYLMNKLRDREFDLVLCRHLDPEQMVGLSFEFLFADPLVAAVRPGHPLLAGDGTASAGQRYEFILPPQTSINRRAIAPLAMALGFGPIVDYIESRSISFGRTYTLASDAVWFVPLCAVERDIDRGELMQLTPPPSSGDDAFGVMERSTGLMMRSDFVPPRETQLLIDAIRACAAQRRAASAPNPVPMLV
jgi:LysR family transcriptional regulator, pca operon transcriptional activator